MPNAGQRIAELTAQREELAAQWKQASDYQEAYYNKHHRPQVFKEGDKVLLSAKHPRLQVPSKKLALRFIGPFLVEEPVGLQAYWLTLLSDLPIYLVFHTSKLKPYRHRQEEPDVLPGPIQLDDVEEPSDQYEVEAILKKRGNKHQVQYLIKWKGWPVEYNEWVKEQDIDTSLVQGFKKGK